ncbi:DUF2285 domain-containing protein [Rhodovulum marinum]|uniref:DUF2285 domain-containing protein n=1 Tax=Rhodovulum marinum TaxID=320662 RepID=UPI00140537A0|nr:DUF2285 domain-containing protein [Rhodovulum marinum]
MARPRRVLGGCDFPADPGLPAPDAPVFWNPAEAPAAVVLVAALPDTGLSAIGLSPDRIRHTHDAGDLVFLQLETGTLLAGAVRDPDQPIGFLLPTDRNWPARRDAMERALGTLVDGTHPPSPLTFQQLRRIQMALRTLDARAEGATLRRIAEAFFGPARVAAEPWATSALKAQVARLAAYGRRLAERGYRDLLAGRPPTRRQ